MKGDSSAEERNAKKYISSKLLRHVTTGKDERRDFQHAHKCEHRGNAVLEKGKRNPNVNQMVHPAGQRSDVLTVMQTADAEIQHKKAQEEAGEGNGQRHQGTVFVLLAHVIISLDIPVANNAKIVNERDRPYTKDDRIYERQQPSSLLSVRQDSFKQPQVAKSINREQEYC